MRVWGMASGGFRRGFVITILSVSLIMMLIVLALSLRNAQLSTERALIAPLPLTYAAFLLDDVAYEFNSIVGTHVGFDPRNDSMTVTVADTLHSYNHSADISNYAAFLKGEVAGRTVSSIDTDFTNLTNGTIMLFINEDYVYANDHAMNESRFWRDGGTGAASYEINLTITAVRANVTPMTFDDDGTMNVTIRYTDVNGTMVESGKVFPDEPNTMKVDYPGGAVSVLVGLDAGNSGSLKLAATGISADASWSVVLPPQNATKRIGYEYDATIGYAQGNVAKRCRIGK